MTFAPQSLLAAQRYLQQHTGMGWDALGIIGDTAHAGGYPPFASALRAMRFARSVRQ